MVEWLKNQDPTTHCLQETIFTYKSTYRVLAKGCQMIFHVTGNQNKAGATIFISDKIVCKSKTVKRDKEGNHIMIKVLNQQKNITILIIYVPNIIAPK